MTKYKTAQWFLLMATIAGITLAADLYREGSVSVALPSNNGESVQAVLQAADTVLLPAGFVRGRISPTGPALIADYTRDISVGSPSACSVFVRNNRAVFSFVESGIPHPTPAAAQLSQQLADALRARFGAAAVEVQLK